MWWPRLPKRMRRKLQNFLKSFLCHSTLKIKSQGQPIFNIGEIDFTSFWEEPQIPLQKGEIVVTIFENNLP